MNLSDSEDNVIPHLLQELRTPLTNMKTALKLLESPLIKPHQRQKYLDLLHGECDRQNSLITGMVELLAIDQVTKEESFTPLCLTDIIPGVVSTYQPLAQEKGIRLGYTLAKDLPTIFCYETWLKTIIIKLLHNGIKYTPSGGQVFVQVTIQQNSVQLVIRDTGIGIHSTEIDKIFNRFYRGKNLNNEDNTGAGLGLTIVAEILSRCGGSISVDSQVNNGSQFLVLLPL